MTESNVLLEDLGWMTAVQEKISADWSARRFYRLKRPDGAKAILVLQPSDLDKDMIKGHTVMGTLKSNALLKRHGFCVPDILKADIIKGFILQEDVGGDNAADLLDRNEISIEKFYQTATSALIRFKGVHETTGLADFNDTHVARNIRFYAAYYWARKYPDNPMRTAGFNEAWQKVLSPLPMPLMGFTHIDFHPGNMMVVGEPLSLQSLCLLDYQGAVWGPQPYDLVNLLYDIRRDVPDYIVDMCEDMYLSSFTAEDRVCVEAWLPVLRFHFHARCAGQLLRVAETMGRDDLLGFMPRIEAYIKNDLLDPALAPMAEFIASCKAA